MWDEKNAVNFNSSYFSGTDLKYGWGNTTFFSFFCQFNRSSPVYGNIEATVFIVIFLLSIYGNIVVLVQLICNRSMRTVTNSFICHLTIADMFLTFGCPLLAVTRITGSWIFGSWACSMMVYNTFVCGFVGIWIMAFISLDRYICIVSRSVTRLTQRSAFFLLGIVWGSAFLCFLPMALYFDVKVVRFGVSHVTICTLIWPKNPQFRISIVFTTILFICGFLIPLSMLTFSYVNIFRKFWNIRQAVVKPQNKPNSSLWMNTLDFKKRRDKRDFGIVKTLFSLLLLFFVMWTPIFIVFVFIVASERMIISSQVFVIAIAVCMGNAVVNPLFYGMMVEQLRARLKSCCKCNKFQSIESATDAEALGENGGIRAVSDGNVADNK